MAFKGDTALAHPELEITAYHEAGHAIVALCSGWKVKEIGIDGNVGGWVKHAGAPPVSCANMTQDNLRSFWVLAVRDAAVEAKIAMAGPFAEAKFLGKSVRALGKFDDFERVVHILTRLKRVRQAVPELADASPNYKQGLFEGIALETAHLLRKRDIWQDVSALAKALLQQHRLSGVEVIEVLERAYSSPDQLRLPLRADTFSQA